MNLVPEVVELQLDRRRWLQRTQVLLWAPLFCRHVLAADIDRFASGVASGYPRPNGMVLWTRLHGRELDRRVPVQWAVSHDEKFEKVVAQGTEDADPAWGFSVHAEPSGLESDRWYWYRFSALGQRSAIGRTRTAPLPDVRTNLKFMIASCQRWDVGHYAAWRNAAAESHDLCLFLGDYIYEYSMRRGEVRQDESGHVNTLAEYRARYALHKSDKSLQAAHAAFPWMVIWDDHEVANNYAGSESSKPTNRNFLRQRAAAYQAYWENMPLPKSFRPVGGDMRIYTRLDWGRLARIQFIDDRQYRSRQACGNPDGTAVGAVLAKDCSSLVDTSRSLLGVDQERWLADGWDTNRPWNLLAQQTLMARMVFGDNAENQRYATDHWDGYVASRNRLLETVVDKKVPGVVVLGGDVHCHTVADLKADFDDPRSAVIASEFCGTSISSHGRDQAITEKAKSLNPHIKYAHSDQRGYIRFQLSEKGLTAELTAVNNIMDAESSQRTSARFAVDPKRAGPQAE